jgi:hypothetical protein
MRVDQGLAGSIDPTVSKSGTATPTARGKQTKSYIAREQRLPFAGAVANDSNRPLADAVAERRRPHT